MEQVIAILSQPITQFGGVLIILFGLQRAGIDVQRIARVLLGLPDKRSLQEETGDIHNDLLYQMRQLSTHFNHDTTDALKDLKIGLDRNFESQRETLEILRAMKEYGIKCRIERPEAILSSGL